MILVFSAGLMFWLKEFVKLVVFLHLKKQMFSSILFKTATNILICKGLLVPKIPILNSKG